MREWLDDPPLVYDFWVRRNYLRLYGHPPTPHDFHPARFMDLVQRFRDWRVSPMDAARALHETERIPEKLLAQA